MKPTQITELFANIKQTFVSFFSIFMFVALGVGVFLGIYWSGPALQNAADKMFDEGQFHNFQIQFVYGLTDDDLAKLDEVEGVSKTEAGYQSFQTAWLGNKKTTVKMLSLPKEIDTPVIVEGELPSKPNEIALHAESAKLLGLSVGDTITFEHDGEMDEGFTQFVSDDATPIGGSTTPADGSAATTDDMQFLTEDSFKVTGIINSADYIAKATATNGYSDSPSGAVDAIAWAPIEAFKPSAFLNAYPTVNVACDSLAGMNTYSDEYKNASEAIQKRIAELGDSLGTQRYDSLHGKAQSRIDDLEKQLNEGKQKVADGENQLEEGRAALESARAEGEQALAEAYQELLRYEDMKAQAESELSAAKRKVAEGEQALAAIDQAKAMAVQAIDSGTADTNSLDERLKRGEITQKQYDEELDKLGASITSTLKPYADQVGYTLPTLDHTNMPSMLGEARSIVDKFEDVPIPYEGRTITVREARKQLDDARKLVSDGEAELAEKTDELNEGWAKYYAGWDELETKTAEGEQRLADGERELENAKAMIAENEPKLQQAKDELADMVKYQWSVLPRSYNLGSTEITTFSDVTFRLGLSMAGLFIVVGLLVSYFAVSRIVYEQTVQIGTKKALGFRKGEITKSFLLYSGIAVLAGAIVGAIMGYFLVEGIIGGVLAGMFCFGTYPAFFGWGLFLVMTLIELALILGATYLACRNILKRHAVELLRGKEPPSGKAHFYEKWKIWDRLPLFVQTIVNNCINDKRRMLSTIIGVAGSTALIVTAITLNNDVLKSYDRHYEDAYSFNAIMYVENSADGDVDNVESALKSEGFTSAPVFTKRYLMEEPTGGSSAMRVVVPRDMDSFSQVYSINPTSGGEVDLSQEGAWVSQAYADHFGAKVGDVITVDAGDGTKHKVPILGFYKFWLTYHEMVMGADYFNKEFDNNLTNAFLVNTKGTSVDDVRNTFVNVPGFDSVVDNANDEYKNFATFSSVSTAVVAIYLVLASLMAIVVLLNLNFMFIDEKKRELIVLMINGFSIKDAKRYISYDSAVLTVIGIIAGIILGCIVGSNTVAAIEPSTACFVKAPDLWAIVIGAIGGGLLAAIMTKISLRRIPKFKLTDINKL